MQKIIAIITIIWLSGPLCAATAREKMEKIIEEIATPSPDNPGIKNSDNSAALKNYTSVLQIAFSGTKSVGYSTGVVLWLWAIYQESLRNVNRMNFDKQDHNAFVQGEMRVAKKPLLTVKPLSNATWAVLAFAGFKLAEETVFSWEDTYGLCQKNPRCKKTADALGAYGARLHQDWRDKKGLR